MIIITNIATTMGITTIAIPPPNGMIENNPAIAQAPHTNIVILPTTNIKPANTIKNSIANDCKIRYNIDK